MVLYEFGLKFGRLFEDTSDRACVVAAGAWIDHLLNVALQDELPSTGQPMTLRKRIDAAFKAGFIDIDLRADLHTIRRLRNEFAHSADADSLKSSRFEQILGTLRVPGRAYSDWGLVRAAALPNGIVIYNGERPSDGREALHLGPLLFRMGLSAVLAVLMGSLPLEVDMPQGGEPVRFELGEHLRRVSPK